MASKTRKGSSHDPTYTGRKRGTWEIIRRVAVYLGPYKLLAAATIGSAVLSLLFTFVFPRMTAFVIDDVLNAAAPQRELLVPVILLIVAAFFLSEAFNSLRIRVNNILEQHVIFDMRRQVYAKLQTLPTNYFDQRASGDLMTRVIEDVNNVERILIDGTEQGTLVVLQLLGVFTILAWMNPALAGVALIPFPFLIAGAWWYSSTAHSRYRDQRRASSAMNALLMDNLQGNREIKAYGREQHEDHRFRDRAEDLRKGTLKIMHAWATYSPSMDFLMAIGNALVLLVGGYQFFNNPEEFKVGELTAFLLYLNLFYEPIRRLHQLNQLLQAARASGERVFDILDSDSERQDREPEQHMPEAVEGRVTFESVSFEYEADLPVLKDLNLNAGPGEMIALVGPTGAGKSTVVNLLPAFYETTAGRITIDGVDISKVPLDELRRHIAVVNQEPFLFNGSVRENILYGRLDATEDEMIEAAKAANCHHFIEQLPDGYDTHVGERGVKLSVGEKQRVSIARAILKNAPILILDEATASVDTATERLIQEALEHLMKGRTSFVIAHRLSTIRNANQILVIRKGQIVERGTHEALTGIDGMYARLCRIQNTTFIEEGFAKLDDPADDATSQNNP